MDKISSEQIAKLNLYIERATFAVALIICAVIPLITFPKPLMDETGYVSTLDFFAYYKSIANNILAIIALTILICRSILVFTAKDKLKINVNMFMFTLWAALSTCFAINFREALFGIGLSYQGFLAYIGYFIFFTIIVNSFNCYHINYLVNVTLTSSTLIAFLCVSEFYGIDIMNAFAETGVYNFPTVVHATFGNSNFVGSYFSLMAPLAIVTYFCSKNSTKSIYLLFFSVTNFVGLVVSTSRISWLSVLASILFSIFYIEKSRLLYIKMIILIVLMLIITLVLDSTNDSILTEKYTNVVNQLTTTQDVRSFGSSRLYIYDRLISQTLRDTKRSFVGVGPDCLIHYGVVSDEDKIKYPFLIVGAISKAHSDLIEYAASMGIPALVFYIGFIGSILFPWLNNKHKTSPEMSGVFAAWLGYLIQSVFNVSTIGIVSIFFVFSAIVYNKANK